ncbi:lysophospholipase [Trametes meyenii]|nr:lysophospholipase [Trametes meyenii]
MASPAGSTSARPDPSPTYTESWLDGPDGHRFYTRTYAATGPPKAVLLFVHGYNDHIARHADTHAAFARRGVEVFAYDMRGFGRTALDEAHRSPGEAFGKTSRREEVRDLEWWVRRLAGKHAGTPIFVMGYSAGGGLTLVFPTRLAGPPSPETVSMLSGVIAVSPLVGLTHRPPEVAKLLVRVVSAVWPTCPFPAGQPPERFSRDPKIVEGLAKDPLRRPNGTALGLRDMILQGEELLASDWRHWPEHLPMLMLWGTADEVNSPVDGIAFFNKVISKNKELVTYQDAVHELMHEAGDIPQRFLDDCVRWIEAHAKAP